MKIRKKLLSILLVCTLCLGLVNVNTLYVSAAIQGAEELIEAPTIELGTTYTFDVIGYYDANLLLPKAGYNYYYYYKIMIPKAGKYTYTFGSSYGEARLVIKDAEFNNIFSAKSVSQDSITDTVKLNEGTYYVGINARYSEETNGFFCLREEGKEIDDPGYNEAEKIYTSDDIGVEGGESLLHCKRIGLDSVYTFDVSGYYDANLLLPKAGFNYYYYYKIMIPKAGKYTYTFGSSYDEARLVIKDAEFNNIFSAKSVSQNSITDTVKLNAGTYYIGINARYGDKTAGKFYIRPEVSLKKVTISSSTRKVKGFSVKWAKVSDATGYQVQYSLSSKMTSAKSKKLAASKTSFSVTGLKAKKTYYVRVRAYHKNSDGSYTYGSWSKIKSIKTK